MANYIEKGKTLLENKEYIKAIEFFQASIESLESVKEANLGLAEAYFAIQKDEQGKVALFKAMALDPNNSQGISMIQKYCLPSWSGNGIPGFLVQNTQHCQDPVVTISPLSNLGRNHYVAEQQSGNTLHFRVGPKGCTIVSPLSPDEYEDLWEGYVKPKGDIYIPEKITVNNTILNVVAIDDFVFDESAGEEKTITSVHLPKGIQKIGISAFCGTAITEIILPSALQHIDDYAFSETLVEEITIPADCKTIGNGCFSECSRLSDVHLNDGLVKIDDHAFDNSGIREIDIPESVREIGYAAFPSSTIIRLHGNPPKLSSIDENRYIVFVPHNKEYLYEEDNDWEYVKVNTY